MSTPTSALRLAATALAATLAACGGGASSPPRTEPTTDQPASTPGATETGSGARSTITERDLKYSQYGRMEDMLARVPGLQVLRDANGYTLRVRGIQTFHGTGEPLVVLDGMPVRAGGVAATLNSVHPRDVTRVDVLKDAGSTAFYGSAGVNGVIVITTRRANPS